MTTRRTNRCFKRLATVALLGVTLLAGAHYLLLAANPVLIVCTDPDARVLIDGGQISFTHGTATLLPWKPSYRVEVFRLGETHRKTIYPWDKSVDSPSIVVDESGVRFHIECVDAD